MEKLVKYINLADRAKKVTEQEASGLRMLYDNFDPEWKPGDKAHGTMAFTDEPEMPAPMVRGRDLAKEIDAIKAKIGM